MGDRGRIIEEAVMELLFGNKSDAINIINSNYWFNNIEVNLKVLYVRIYENILYAVKLQKGDV